MRKRYTTSGTPKLASSTVMVLAERGKNSRKDVEAYQERLHADRVHKRRSNGQRIRQARERLYGKQSHLVTVRYIEK